MFGACVTSGVQTVSVENTERSFESSDVYYTPRQLLHFNGLSAEHSRDSCPNMSPQHRHNLAQSVSCTGSASATLILS